MLTEFKKAIDDIDELLVKLLEIRMTLYTEIVPYKLKSNIILKDERREKEIIERCVNLLQNKEFEEDIEDIVRVLITTCNDIQYDNLFR